MNWIDKEKFFDIVRQKGIRVELRPDCAYLCFEADPKISRFWETPKEASEIPYFVKTILDALDVWDSAYVWKHFGSWVFGARGKYLNEDVQAVIYRAMGIGDRDGDILQFNKGDLTELVTLIFNQLVFGWNVEDDLYIVPDHGKQIVQTDHHKVVHVSFSDEATMKKFADKMAGEGFALPKDPPDETIKKPDWMK
jgi:hypothetical protein